MSEVTINARANGPFLVQGPVTITDHEGNAFPIAADKPSIALCRCGTSANRPFCDGSHSRCNFHSEETAPPV